MSLFLDSAILSQLVARGVCGCYEELQSRYGFSLRNGAGQPGPRELSGRLPVPISVSRNADRHVMAFGGGVLISALVFELMDEVFAAVVWRLKESGLLTVP